MTPGCGGVIPVCSGNIGSDSLAARSPTGGLRGAVFPPLRVIVGGEDDVIFTFMSFSRLVGGGLIEIFDIIVFFTF
jgi:hypothetical protein